MAQRGLPRLTFRQQLVKGICGTVPARRLRCRGAFPVSLSARSRRSVPPLMQHSRMVSHRDPAAAQAPLQRPAPWDRAGRRCGCVGDVESSVSASNEVPDPVLPHFSSH